MQIFKAIRTAIQTTITDNLTGSGKTIAYVYPTDRSKFQGYPAVIITPSDNEADYGDTSMKQLDITFTVRAHVQMPQDGQEAADLKLEEVVDDLLTLFADSTILGSACEWVSPTPSVWGYQDRETGPVRTAEIKLRCRKYIGN